MSSPKKETTPSREAQEIIEEINKKYREGIITTLGESKFKDYPTLSTGSLILDREAGGGYPVGKIVEIYGENSSGKTTLALHAVRECQKLGKRAAWFDIENALIAKNAQNIGVNISELLVLYPNTGEETFKLMTDLVKEEEKKKKFGLIVVDSVAALMPEKMLGDFEEPVIGAHARMMNNGLKQILHEMTNRETIVIFINQIRNKISTGYFSFGSPKTTTGGVALTYFSSLRIELKNKKERVEKEGKYIGTKVWVRVEKTRLVPDYTSPKDKDSKEKPLEIMFKGGIQKEREIVDLAAELNILQKGGSWYSYSEKKLGQGKENVVDYLKENPALFQEIEEKVVEKLAAN
ncbi:MAG: recombinase A [Mycoplasmataceae bacterium RC_NB112A]|nr:MAG: recombinase A [Mycoplasmataceae bacterium RC_NB112A]